MSNIIPFNPNHRRRRPLPGKSPDTIQVDSYYNPFPALGFGLVLGAAVFGTGLPFLLAFIFQYFSGG